MFRLPALLLAALMALTPVLGALCADGCDIPPASAAAEPALSCEHGEAPGSSPVMTAADCSTARSAVVVAEVRNTGALAAPAMSVTLRAAAPRLQPILQHHLHYQFAPPPLRAVLRI